MSTLTNRSRLHLVRDDEEINQYGLTTPEDVGSQLVLALEHSYNSIRREVEDIPAAVIVISSSASKYGHFATARWTVEDARLPEIMISAEGLRRPPRDVLATLIHEAAHGVAHTRRLDCCGPECKHFQDTSNRGRFHNKRFAAIAEELNLQVMEPVKVLGHTNTVLPEGEHDELVEALTPKLIAYREFDVVKKPVRKGPQNNVAFHCWCDPKRTIRVWQGVYDQGPIICGVCGEEFG